MKKIFQYISSAENFTQSAKHKRLGDQDFPLLLLFYIRHNPPATFDKLVLGNSGNTENHLFQLSKAKKVRETPATDQHIDRPSSVMTPTYIYVPHQKLHLRL